MDAFHCGYCQRPIIEGQHYIRLGFALDTAGMAFLLSEPTLIGGVEFCTPACAQLGVRKFVERCITDAIVQDVFDPRHG